MKISSCTGLTHNNTYNRNGDMVQWNEGLSRNIP
jgi:hypothetical protein